MGYFVYKTTNTKNGKFYVGVHGGDVDDGYLGSGKLIIQAVRKHGVESFTREILFEYDNMDDALAKEAEIVNLDFIARADTYNLIPGGGMPPTSSGEHHPNYGKPRPDASARMKQNNPMLNAEVREKVRGTAVYVLADGGRVRIKKDDPRVVSGEAKPINAGKVTVRDEFGKVFHVQRDDPRYLSGELKHVTKGTKRSWTDEERREKYKTRTGVRMSDERKAARRLLPRKPLIYTEVQCPHCGKVGKNNVMPRWHFDNCRNKHE